MTDAESHVPVTYLRECLRHEDGVLFWLHRPRHHFLHAGAWNRSNQNAGRAAGRINSKGYVLLELSLEGAKHVLLGHRVVWALEHGDWPSQVIDHINRMRADNRPSNLRDVHMYTNYRNTKKANGIGLTGAYRTKGGRFMSGIKRGEKLIYLGTFDTAAEANAAFAAARVAIDGAQEKTR